MLCRGSSEFVNEIQELKLIKLNSEHKFLCQVAHQIFDPSIIDQIWFVQYAINRSDIHEVVDDMFTTAREEYLGGKSFEHTLLGHFITCASEKADEIVMWYANDWKDLTNVYSKQKLIFFLQENLKEATYEVYLRYLKKPGEVS